MYQQPSQVQGLLANRKFILIISAALLAVIVAIGVLISGNNNSIQPSLQHLSARYDSLVTLAQTVSSSHQIGNENLAKLNSEALTVFTSDGASFASLTKAKYGDMPAEITAAEADKSSKDKLDTAQLTNTYNSVYAQLLASKLTTLLSLVTECQNETTDVQTLSLLKTASKNTVLLQDRLSALQT